MHHEAVLAGADHLELRPARGGRPDHLPGGLRRRGRRPGRGNHAAHSEPEVPHALVGGGGDLTDLQAPGCQDLAGPFGHLPGFRHIDLVQGDDPRPPGHVGAGGLGVGGQFRLDRVQVGHGIPVWLPRRARSAVEHVHQHHAALHVAQEVQAEPFAAAGAGNQPGHVGHYELGVACLHHAQVRGERGERIVRDLGPGRGHGRDQRGLARVGEAHQARVGHGLELKHQGVLGTRLAAQREPGGPAPG